MRHGDLAAAEPSAGADLRTQWDRVVKRRSFLRAIGLAGAAVPMGALSSVDAAAEGGRLGHGDAAILRFLVAAEIIESDLWTQYSELVRAGGGNAAYTAALQNIDSDMPKYIADNTDDELSHAAFLNAYLGAHGAEPVNLDRFRTLPGTDATGSTGAGRLTNLLQLDLDTSWYTRYRGDGNPDLGATFPQAVTVHGEPAVPLSDADTPPQTLQPVPPVTAAARRMQAIANTAALHFAQIEQGGASLYAVMSLKATSLEVLRIVVSIGGVEVDHFSLWHDKAANALSAPLAGVTDPETGVTFPDLNGAGGELTQTNLILPEPCAFLSPSLPACSVVRPSTVGNAGAVASVEALTRSRLFQGQPAPFFEVLSDLAEAADAARREM
jgi:hypothetical protein